MATKLKKNTGKSNKRYTSKKFLKSLKTVEKVQILPYHSMGKFKWEKLGSKYELEEVRDANQIDVDRVKKILGI